MNIAKVQILGLFHSTVVIKLEEIFKFPELLKDFMPVQEHGQDIQGY